MTPERERDTVQLEPWPVVSVNSMRIPFLSPPTDGEETPLWRHPEVGLIDWLIQLSFPLLLPLERMTTAALSGDLSLLLELRGKMDQRDGVQHDSVFSEWRLTLLQMSRADGSTLEARLYHPPGSGDTLLPVVLWFHGGGYTLSTARDSHGATFAAELAAMVAEAPKAAQRRVPTRPSDSSSCFEPPNRLRGSASSTASLPSTRFRRHLSTVPPRSSTSATRVARRRSKLTRRLSTWRGRLQAQASPPPSPRTPRGAGSLCARCSSTSRVSTRAPILPPLPSTALRPLLRWRG